MIPTKMVATNNNIRFNSSSLLIDVTSSLLMKFETYSAEERLQVNQFHSRIIKQNIRTMLISASGGRIPLQSTRVDEIKTSNLFNDLFNISVPEKFTIPRKDKGVKKTILEQSIICTCLFGVAPDFLTHLNIFQISKRNRK